MRLASALLLGFLDWIGIDIAVCGFVSRRYTTEDIKAAEVMAHNVRIDDRRIDEQTERIPFPDIPKAKAWYEPIDFKNERFNGIGKLLIVPVKNRRYAPATVDPKAKPTAEVLFEYDAIFAFKHCSAFYVGKKLLATAAHCLRNNGVTEENMHVILFRQQYDATKPRDAKREKQYERVVTEWIYMNAYENRESNTDAGPGAVVGEAKPKTGAPAAVGQTDDILAGWDHASGFDIAFLRTKDPGEGKDAYYELISPEDVLPKPEPVKKPGGISTAMVGNPGVVVKKEPERSFLGIKEFFRGLAAPSVQPNVWLLTVGYPQEAADKFKPVSVECELADGRDSYVTGDPGLVASQAEIKQTLSSIEGNQLFCVSATGNIGVGGSGGPWFLAEDIVKKISKSSKDQAKKLRWVVGLNSWGRTRIWDVKKDSPDFEKSFWESQKQCKVVVGPWFRPSSIEIYRIVKKTPDDVPLKDALTKALKLDEKDKLGKKRDQAWWDHFYKETEAEIAAEIK